MGVYIKDMEMPESCDVCDFVYDLNEGDLGIHNYCGFPGIGKSSIGGWNNCIDLESSYFSRTKDSYALSSDDWVWRYCETALNLANQGYTVLISCHESVRDYLHEKVKYRALSGCNVPIVIFRPSSNMKEDWAIRLVNRYLKSGLDKDLRAFEGAIKYWGTDMQYMNAQYLPIYYPKDITYDLRDCVLKIRKKEGCDDAEETDSSLEQVAGVEETRLDDPVVEENSDTFRDCSE